MRETLLRRSLVERGGRVYTDKSLMWEADVPALWYSMCDNERYELVRWRVRADLAGWGFEKDMVRFRGAREGELVIVWSG